MNLHQEILTKKERKLKCKPWITIYIQQLMQKMDKLYHQHGIQKD